MKRLAATLAVALGALLAPAAASGAVFEVGTLEDLDLGPEACTVSFQCSLRDAIDRANETPAADEITFGGLFHGTIEPESPLPPVLWPARIDATTAADYSDVGHPVVLLSGGAVSAPESRGIELGENAGGSRVEGLAVGGFRVGIFTYAESTVEICGNYVGLEPDGETALPNEYAGVSTGGTGDPGEGARIGYGCDGNLISGNAEFGILEAGERTRIAGNEIGVDANGDPLPNGDPFLVSSGIEVHSSARELAIGGTGPGEGNLIAHNTGPGIRVQGGATKPTIRANRIFANSGGGILFSGGDPTFSTYVEAFAGTVWFGRLTAAEANAEYGVDLFANSRCDGSGRGQGEVFLGSDTIETDALAEAQWSIDAGPLAGIDAESFTATVTALASGETSQFSVCARTRPDASLLTTPPALTSSPAATFSFSGSDLGQVVGFLCSLDGGAFSSCSTPHQVSGLADGPHSFEVRAVDAEEFFTWPGPTHTWTVDATAPLASIESGPAAATTATDASLSFSAVDATSGVERLECSLDGGAFAACESPRQLTGLGLGSHSFAVRAVDKAGNQGAAATHGWQVVAPPAAGSSQPPAGTRAAPEFRESVAVAPAGGKVFVFRPGKGRTELREGETIPVGSVVDATRGKVTLTSVNRAGEVQAAVFYGGRFLVAEQERSGLVVLKLRGPVRCGVARGSVAAASAARKGRRLWGSGKGRFRTEGNHGSATVRGTVWLTEDRCNATFFKVRKGVVTVRDFPRGRTLALPAGRSYLAKKPG